MALSAPRRLSAAERREAILDAARRVFSGRGYEGATTREVAAEAGVSEALLYQHFPGKRDLFRAVMERAAGDLERRVIAAAASGDSFLAAAEAYFGFVEDERELHRLFFRQALQADPAFADLYERIAARFVDLLGVPPLVAEALIGMANQVALWWTETGHLTRSQVARTTALMAEAAYQAALTLED